MSHLGTSCSKCLYLVIKPERASSPYAVSLWATWPGESGPCVMATPEDSWHEYSRRLEHSGVLDSSSLGCVDAHVGRGEPVVRYVSCSLPELHSLGLRDVPRTEGKRLPVDALQQKLSSDTVEPQFAEPLAANEQIALLGVRVNNVSTDEVVAQIDALIEKGGFHQIATANVDFLNKAAADTELMEILHQCELVLADGMPLVWASRMMGTPLKERVTGADLLPRLLELSVLKKRRIFLLGASEDCSQCALQRVCREYPGAIVCGRLSPPAAALDQMDHAMILQRIEEAKPDILLVAFGNPKQEKWLAMHRDQLNVPVCIGVGGAFDFFSEKQVRAPMWMQRLCLEWVFRFMREPRRMGPRYLGHAIFLLRYLSQQLVVTSVQPRSTEATKVSITRRESAVIVRVAGNFTGPAVTKLQRDLETELENGDPLIVDLTSATTIWPDAAGLLALLTHQDRGSESQVWLVGVRRGVQEVLRRTFPAGHYFRRAATLEEALRALSLSSPELSEPRVANHPAGRKTAWNTQLNLYQWE